LAGPALLDGAGQASFSASTLSAGTHTITACYSGDGTFDPSNGSVNQTVNQVALSGNSRGYMTTPQELVAVAQKATQGIQPYKRRPGSAS
jgi:hypothetical protein